MRSAVEEQLTLIALGRADFHAVLLHTVEIFKQKFHYFVQSIDAMDQLFEVSFSPLSASGKSHSRFVHFKSKKSIYNIVSCFISNRLLFTDAVSAGVT